MAIDLGHGAPPSGYAKMSADVSSSTTLVYLDLVYLDHVYLDHVYLDKDHHCHVLNVSCGRELLFQS